MPEDQLPALRLEFLEIGGVGVEPRGHLFIHRVDVVVVIECPPVPIRTKHPARRGGVWPRFCLESEAVACSGVALASERSAGENALARPAVDRPLVILS